ncbi:F-box domain-containing protein, partial [Pyrenophora tritici-repentis]
GLTCLLTTVQLSPQLLGPASEIVENVVKQISDRRDLSNARLACKTLEKHAAQGLFKDVFVSQSEEQMDSWNSISQDDVIRRIPCHAIIHTHSDIDDHGYGSSREIYEVGEDFEGALTALSRFPNLDSVEIGFTPEDALAIRD